MEGTAIRLKDAIKGHRHDQDKLLAPAETVRRFRKILRSANLDILSETRRVDSGRLGIPVCASYCRKDVWHRLGMENFWGKGATPDQAEASAVMELAERYSYLEFRERLTNFVFDTAANLGEEAIPFDQIAKSVSDNSSDVERLAPFFANVPLAWARADNLTRGRRLLVPFYWFYQLNFTNGSAAGNCVEEALCQGVCEVVERHVSTLVDLDERRTPALERGSITDPVSLELLGKFDALGVRLHLRDFTLGMGMPTIGVLAWDPTTFPHRSEIHFIAGTSTSPHKALNRALTEVAQGAADFDTDRQYTPWALRKFKSLEEAGFVTSAAGDIRIEQMPDIEDINIRVEVERCIARLAERGFEVYAVDISHPVLKIPASFVIVPGAQCRYLTRDFGVGHFLAKIIFEDANRDYAFGKLKELASLVPDRYYPHFFLGNLLLERGQPAEAEASYRKAAALLEATDPGHRFVYDIHLALSVSLQRMARYREVVGMTHHVLPLARGRVDFFNTLGAAHYALNEYDEAVAAYRCVLEQGEEAARAYTCVNIAIVYMDKGDNVSAGVYFREALRCNGDIFNALARSAKRSGRPGKAMFYARLQDRFSRFVTGGEERRPARTPTRMIPA